MKLAVLLVLEIGVLFPPPSGDIRPMVTSEQVDRWTKQWQKRLEQERLAHCHFDCSSHRTET